MNEKVPPQHLSCIFYLTDLKPKPTEIYTTKCRTPMPNFAMKSSTPLESKEILVDSASQLKRTKDEDSVNCPQHHQHQIQRKLPSSPITEEASRN